MSSQSSDDIVVDPAIAADPGAGLEALRRRTTVAPPPPPVMAKVEAAPEPAPAPTTLVGESKPAQPRTVRRPRPSTSEPEAAEQDRLLGQAKGNVRQISTRLPLALRQQLLAASRRDELTLGEVAMDAVRIHHQALRDRNRPRDVDGRGFAPPRRRAKRSLAGEKVPTPMSVTPEEAEALQALAHETSMSVNRIIIECLEAAYPGGAPLSSTSQPE